MRRLHEHGQAERRGPRQCPIAILAPLRRRDPDVADLLHLDRSHQVFEQDLVHADSRRGDSRADIRGPERLEHPLDRAVLAERAVSAGNTTSAPSTPRPA